MSLIESVRPLKDKLTAIRRDIHAHPELAFAEHRTAELVARQLESLGIETHRGIGGTGVVGVVRGRRGLRARSLWIGHGCSSAMRSAQHAWRAVAAP